MADIAYASWQRSDFQEKVIDRLSQDGYAYVDLDVMAWTLNTSLWLRKPEVQAFHKLEIPNLFSSKPHMRSRSVGLVQQRLQQLPNGLSALKVAMSDPEFEWLASEQPAIDLSKAILDAIQPKDVSVRDGRWRASSPQGFGRLVQDDLWKHLSESEKSTALRSGLLMIADSSDRNTHDWITKAMLGPIERASAPEAEVIAADLVGALVTLGNTRSELADSCLKLIDSDLDEVVNRILEGGLVPSSGYASVGDLSSALQLLRTLVARQAMESFSRAHPRVGVEVGIGPDGKPALRVQLPDPIDLGEFGSDYMGHQVLVEDPGPVSRL